MSEPPTPAEEPPRPASPDMPVAKAQQIVTAPPIAEPVAKPGETQTAVYSGPIRSGSAPSAGSLPRHATPVPLAWRSWPVADSVGELLVLTCIVVAVPLVVWSVTGQAAMTVACGLAVALVVSRNFVPTTYELNALGVTTKSLGRSRRIPWISIDRFVVGRRGVFLSSTGAPLEIFRGMYIPWGSHREQILGSLRYYLPHAEVDDEE